MYKKINEETNIEIIDDNTQPINYPISLEEVQSAINDLKPRSSPGPDGISYDMLKQFPEETINQIHKIYDYIWTNNVFPTKWKNTYTIPTILKYNCKKTDPKSYRPISLTNCLSKLLQKIVNRRLLWYLETTNALN